MSVGDNLKKICGAARPLIEEKLDLDDQFAELRDAAAEQGLSWGAIRSILLAEARDAKDGGDRLNTLAERHALATDYLALLQPSSNVAESLKTSPHLNSTPPIAGLSAAAFPDDGSIPPNLRR